MKAECPFDSAVFCSLTQSWTRLESKTTTIEPKSRQEGMLNSPVLNLWLPWFYFSRLLRSCIGTVGLFSLPRSHRVLCLVFLFLSLCTVQAFVMLIYVN